MQEVTLSLTLKIAPNKNNDGITRAIYLVVQSLNRLTRESPLIEDFRLCGGGTPIVFKGWRREGEEDPTPYRLEELISNGEGQ